MSLSVVSNETLTNFNTQTLKLIKLLAEEFPTINEVKLLKVKVNMALTASKRSLYDLFCTRVKPEHTMKIMSDDVGFIEDAKDECKEDQDAAAFLPVIVMLWEKGGKVTPDPAMLQKKVMFHLKSICLATLPPSITATMKLSPSGSSKKINNGVGGKVVANSTQSVKSKTAPYVKSKMNTKATNSSK